MLKQQKVLLSIDANRDTAFALDLESKFEVVAMFVKPVLIYWEIVFKMYDWIMALHKSCLQWE